MCRGLKCYILHRYRRISCDPSASTPRGTVYLSISSVQFDSTVQNLWPTISYMYTHTHMYIPITLDFFNDYTAREIHRLLTHHRQYAFVFIPRCSPAAACALRLSPEIEIFTSIRAPQIRNTNGSGIKWRRAATLINLRLPVAFFLFFSLFLPVFPLSIFLSLFLLSLFRCPWCFDAKTGTWR